MDAVSPIEAAEQKVWTVSQLTAHIKQTLEASFSDVCVMGEVSEFTRAASGHLYLTLKDEGAVLRCIVWRLVALRMKFELEEGLEVVVRGRVDVYAPRGSYQLIISDVQPRGLGALQLAFRQLLERLQKEGLFAPEHKKPLPPYPRRIGIVTSPTGAAIRDMIRVITRRWPLAHIYLLPRRVQGEGAAEEIAGGIYLLNARRPDLDVIIVGRGGGSLEDLWAFNEEIVARAIFASQIPIISAVGHEIDFCVSDFVADVRAATPTEAGEKVVPDQREVERHLAHLKGSLARSLQGIVAHARQQLAALARSPVLRRPEAALQQRAQMLDELFGRIQVAVRHMLEMVRERLRAVAAKLDALSPLRVLERGYSVTLGPDGAVLRSPEGLARGDVILTRMLRGEVRSSVLDVRRTDALSAEEGDAHGS